MESHRPSRSTRHARINYAELASGVILENDNPNTASQSQRGIVSKQRSKAAIGAKSALSNPRALQRSTCRQHEQPTSVPTEQTISQDEASAQHPMQQSQERDACGETDQPTAEQARKRKRQRTLVGACGTAVQPSAQHSDECDNDYERARLERIRRNQEVLAQLGIDKMAQSLMQSCHQGQQQSGAAGNTRPHRPKERLQRQRAAPLHPQPARKSARMRGQDPTSQEAEAGAGGSMAALDQDPDEVGLLSLREYFELQGQDLSGALVVDGRYHGWVHPDICQRYGLAGTADEAWESNGGGKFTFKIDKKAIPAHLRSKGWSDARAFASTQLQKNPNSYFYRHVAPHEQQAQGEWTEEEHELFLSTVRDNGVGDKWGLFASYIPQRVGYQCSAYYRDVIIPSGLIIDDRFKITRNGRAIFKG